MQDGKYGGIVVWWGEAVVRKNSINGKSGMSNHRKVGNSKI